MAASSRESARGPVTAGWAPPPAHQCPEVCGVLMLVATPIANATGLAPRAREELASASAIACVDIEQTENLLRAIGVTTPRVLVVAADDEGPGVSEALELLGLGQRVAMVFDTTALDGADAGSVLVQAAADAGHTVQVVPGPSTAVAALIVSGLPVARWCFEGVLPAESEERRVRLAQIAGETRTVVLAEVPERLAQTLTDLLGACGGARRVAVVREQNTVRDVTWRGTLEGTTVLATEADVTVVSGPSIVVVEGAGPSPAASDAEVAERLAVLLAEGLSRKAAVAEVVQALGLPKRRVYQLSLDLTSGPGH